MDQAQYSCLEIDTEQRVWSVQLHDVMLQLVNVRVYNWKPDLIVMFARASPRKTWLQLLEQVQVSHARRPVCAR